MLASGEEAKNRQSTLEKKIILLKEKKMISCKAGWVCVQCSLLKMMMMMISFIFFTAVSSAEHAFQCDMDDCLFYSFSPSQFSRAPLWKLCW